MLGFLTLVEAEDLSHDIPNGDAWREDTPLWQQEVSGSFETVSPPSRDITGPAGKANGDCILFDDLPFELSGAPSPYIASRITEFPSPATVIVYYDFGNGPDARAICARYADRRAYLLQAFAKLCSLPGYVINESVQVTNQLQRAQLICANTARESGNASSFYQQLLNAGVKREKRGDAETEFFSPADRLQTELVGEVVDLLKNYRASKPFGPVLKADQTLNQAHRSGGQ